MKPNILNILSKININKILTNTSKTLNIVKKTIPIYKEIKKSKPDYIIITPWNLKNEIKKQLDYTQQWGCKFITLIPDIEIF